MLLILLVDVVLCIIFFYFYSTILINVCFVIAEYKFVIDNVFVFIEYFYYPFATLGLMSQFFPTIVNFVIETMF